MCVSDEDTAGRCPSASQEDLTRIWPSYILISDFRPPKLWENNCLFLKAPSLWYFVMAAQADKHSNAFNSHYSLLFENINYNAYFGSTTPMAADCLRIWPLGASPSRYRISNSSQKWSKVKMGKLPKACLWNLPEPLCHSQLQAEEPISSPKHMPPH